MVGQMRCLLHATSWGPLEGRVPRPFHDEAQGDKVREVEGRKASHNQQGIGLRKAWEGTVAGITTKDVLYILVQKKARRVVFV